MKIRKDVLFDSIRKQIEVIIKRREEIAEKGRGNKLYLDIITLKRYSNYQKIIIDRNFSKAYSNK